MTLMSVRTPSGQHMTETPRSQKHSDLRVRAHSPARDRRNDRQDVPICEGGAVFCKLLVSGYPQAPQVGLKPGVAVPQPRQQVLHVSHSLRQDGHLLEDTGRFARCSEVAERHTRRHHRLSLARAGEVRQWVGARPAPGSRGQGVRLRARQGQTITLGYAILQPTTGSRPEVSPRRGCSRARDLLVAGGVIVCLVPGGGCGSRDAPEGSAPHGLSRRVTARPRVGVDRERAGSPPTSEAGSRGGTGIAGGDPGVAGQEDGGWLSIPGGQGGSSGAAAGTAGLEEGGGAAVLTAGDSAGGGGGARPTPQGRAGAGGRAPAALGGAGGSGRVQAGHGGIAGGGSGPLSPAGTAGDAAFVDGGKAGNLLAGQGGAAGSSCLGCLPAHCKNALFEPELGELLLDCGGECAGNCYCAGWLEPTLGTVCSTGLGGTCEEGIVSCLSDGTHCQPNGGTPEICDGTDNDCNGLADYPYELTDADSDQWPACADSDDADPDNWTAAGTCVDSDGDGFYLGCDAYSVRSGPDCDDQSPEACPRNVILFIGDGMGFHHLRAARCYKNGNLDPLVLETLPARGSVTTASASDEVTDSAAAATAMATGRKVNNGVIAMAFPGDEADLLTVLEIWKGRGQGTGLVTVHDTVVGATPAAFGAHAASRGATSEIATDLRTASQPTVLFGDVNGSLVAADFIEAGYEVLESEEDLLDLELGSAQRWLGLFPEPGPRLVERTAAALRVLEGEPNGFFLMVEQADTDRQSHGNNLSGVVEAVVELDEAVELALTWSQTRTDTLLIVTADHETGGLICPLGDYQPATAGVVPDCAFTTGSHTGASVPIFAVGPGASQIAGTLDNTAVFALTAGIGPSP